MMSDIAAQPNTEPVPPVDVLDELAGDQPSSQREAVMEEIAAARLEELREDGVESPPVDAGEAEEGETPPPEPEPELDDDGAPRQPLPDEPLYTVKVDGQERQVPLSELTANYQIQSAARNSLGQAREVLRQARQTEQPAAPAPAVEQPPSDGLDGIDFDRVAERLQYGEGAEAGNALKDMVVELRNRGGSPGGAAPSAEQIETRVFEKIEWTTALNRFGDEYQDILKDPRVAGIAGANSRELYQKAMQDCAVNGTPRRPYYDIFKEAGDRTRQWRDRLIGQQTGDSETPPNGTPAVNLSPDRDARKRAAVQPPTPRSGAGRAGARRDRAPKSDEQRQREGIHEIQRARGQR